MSASTANMQWHITFEAPLTRTWRPAELVLETAIDALTRRTLIVANLLGKRLVAAGVDVNQRDVAE